MSFAELDRTSVDAPTDVEFVRQVLDGNRESFRVLVERHQGRVFTIARRIVGNVEDAEDLTQQSFIEAFTALRSYDPGRRFVTWLLRIATNNCKDHLKSHKRRERQLRGEVESAMFSGFVAGPEQASSSRERARALEAALMQLAPKYRMPLLLKDVEGLSYKEIKAVLRLPVTTLKIRVVRARHQLRDKLHWTRAS